jgi:hypothetical protein
LSYTQHSTYDVVQVRDDSSKTVANEAFLLWLSCSASQFTYEFAHFVSGSRKTWNYVYQCNWLISG